MPSAHEFRERLFELCDMRAPYKARTAQNLYHARFEFSSNLGLLCLYIEKWNLHFLHLLRLNSLNQALPYPTLPVVAGRPVDRL